MDHKYLWVRFLLEADPNHIDFKLTDGTTFPNDIPIESRGINNFFRFPGITAKVSTGYLWYICCFNETATIK